ncbi:MAG: hypothetical protein RLZ28_1209 [Actinomycetota bacterium]|jgi:hypothetical protein
MCPQNEKVGGSSPSKRTKPGFFSREPGFSLLRFIWTRTLSFWLPKVSHTFIEVSGAALPATDLRRLLWPRAIPSQAHETSAGSHDMRRFSHWRVRRRNPPSRIALGGSLLTRAGFFTFKVYLDSNPEFLAT